MRKREPYDKKKAVKKMARERVGTVKASRPIEPKAQRKKPKHKPPLETELD
ncbi:MAG TPA: hypothetical protein VKG25_10230 [Bryobacteraceae bacterium]|nr:hypothetical protein [Bryobacteraceae bacterium]